MRAAFLVAVGLSLFVSGTGVQATESVTVHAWSSTNGPEHHRFRLPRVRRETILRAVEDANFFALPEFVGPSPVPIHGPENCLEIQIRGRVLKVFLNDPASATSDEVERFRKAWRAVSASSPVQPPVPSPVAGQTAGQTPSACRFPGARESCPAPRGSMMLEWHEPNAAGRHELWLRVIPNGTRAKLLEFDRGVEALWSPDGRALAMTDHVGSSDSVIWVASGEGLTRLVNVEDRLRASLGELPEIFENGHRYFEVVRWLRADLLLFRVRAYDRHPGKEYVRTFRYDLRGRVSRDRRR